MRVVKLTSLNIVFPKYFQKKKKKERGSQLFRKICCCLIDPHRGVFRNQSNVYGGGFLQKQLIDFSLTIFAKGSNIDVGLGLELVSEINMTTKMTTSKKNYSMTSRQLFIGSGVIAGFRIFTIIGTLWEKESREHTLKYFIPNYILILCSH